MRKEPIYRLTEKGEFVIEGFEILADFPQLLVNTKLDFAVFKIHIEQINKERDSNFIYHLNVMMDTLKESVDEIVKLVKASPVSNNIVIEILEEDIKDNTLEKIISIFADNRIKISIDDFGTRSSNFDRLLKYRDIIESIKIDRIMWKNMPYVVKAMVEELDVKIIAEKVETKEELDSLVESGIKLFQGWFFKNNFKDIDSISKIPNTNDFNEDFLFHLLKEALSMLVKSNEEKNIDNLLKYFKLVYLAHKLNIPYKSEDIMMIKKYINSLSDNKPELTSDETIKKVAKIAKYISSEVMYLLQEVQEIKQSISNRLYNKEYDNLDKLVYELFSKLKILSDSIKEKEIELKVVESALNESSEVIDRPNLKKIVLSSILENSKEDKTCILIVNFPELDNIYYNIGYNFFEKSRKKVVEAFYKLFPKDTVIVNYDNSTFLIFVLQSQLKYIDRLHKLFENTEILVNNKFINFRPKIATFFPEKHQNETIDDVVVRLESKIYEIKNFEDEPLKNENNSIDVGKKAGK